MLKVGLSHCVLHVVIVLSGNLDLVNDVLKVLERAAHVSSEVTLIHIMVFDIRVCLDLVEDDVQHLIL